jgi:hypothetical protein
MMYVILYQLTRELDKWKSSAYTYASDPFYVEWLPKMIPLYIENGAIIRGIRAYVSE